VLRPLRARLTRAANLLGAFGVGRSFTLLPRWLVLRREFIAVARPIPARAREIPALAGVQCRMLGEAELPAFAAGCPELTVGEVRRRWAAGLECLVLWRGPAIAAYRWDVTAAVGALYLPYLGTTARLAPGDVLAYDPRTLPASRRPHLGAELVATAVERARTRGDRRYVSLIAAWNHASLRWAEHLGWERVGSVGYRRVGLRRRYFATGAMALIGREVRFLPSAEPNDLPLRATLP
jgi:GNAT superfamily N-acetyltransferase